ncbi:c-type cytochrome [Oharaeibacter diazotrophicus]|uniref:Mono/diheme cytochrome c family protein n=1 Tax=Oharaeibacter diazotrophicus TaxID=1920512 RepID=A0A4R6RIV7_9HYPH|nr:cytochrome c [Oharaeibacter diazotrophicus]TDP86469.1 mono/diheme cytochrome c family protein [Oharaeibacter diazotrophicus]BBE71589.1 cytochrome c [Pleomorphomonas sp. SM30]GLS78350.1 hypothetical protein GCM10007904_36870 [Oharaeibacter diazotrophicus]
MKTTIARAARLAAATVVLGTALAPSAASALDSIGEGRRLYLKYNCYGCHGMRGGGAMGPRLIGEAEFSDVREKVLFGADEGMPSYGRFMTSTDIANLAAYLGTLGRKNEPVFTHWWEKVPSR